MHYRKLLEGKSHVCRTEKTRQRVDVCVLLHFQMFERETKREKVLVAQQREIRLKEKGQMEQGKEEEGGQEELEESPEKLTARAEKDFYSMIEME